MDHEKHSGDTLGISQEDLEALFESTFKGNIEKAPEKESKEHPNTPLFEGSFEGSKTASRFKSSLRMKYEAEVSSIKKTHGDLEKIRRQIGLSKRKVAQLLLVDPSAWTRWTKKDGEAPPHIYRALEWFLLLQDKHPEYKSALWLNSVATPSLSEHEIENIKNEVVQQARAQLDQMPTYIETESVDLTPIERRLKSSQAQVMKLQGHLKWLIISQFALLLVFLLALIF